MRESRWVVNVAHIVASRLLKDAPFVLRQAQAEALLRRLLGQVARGHGALTMIGGEPGAGRTRREPLPVIVVLARPLLATPGQC